MAFAMLMYISLFYFISQRGIRIMARVVTSFFSGGVIPLPFFPDGLRRVLEMLPFGSMQNMPLQIFCGNMGSEEALKGIVLRIFWLFMMVLAGCGAFLAALQNRAKEL